MLCVDVAINLPVKNLFKQYTYFLPEQLNFLNRGWRCVVPFGSQTVEGFIVQRRDLIVDETKIKPVMAALGKEPWFDQEMLATAQWLAEYYMCTLAEAMRLFVPGKSSIKRHLYYDDKGTLLYYEYEEQLKEKTLLAYAINPLGIAALQTGSKRAKGQMNALAILQKAKEPMTGVELEKLGINSSILRTLVAKGQLQVTQKRVLRNSYQGHQAKDTNLILTAEQQRAVQEVQTVLYSGKYAGYLLRGITGSGKTEVYLHVAEEALNLGKQVLVLVPEIALTAQLVERFKARFGERIAVAHSKLSRNERGDVCYRMASCKADILIGVRSAVFAPFKNLGLIIMDEEHESSYKQEERPNYHARAVAEERCRHSGAVLLLGSATPSLETYFGALTGKYQELLLSRRPLGQPLPQAAIIDMRRELAEKNYNVLSRSLRTALSRLPAAGEQGIVLLNRRGYATFVICRDCGFTVKCEHCDVAMVYHQWDNIMRCHYCGNTLPVPQKCPACHSRRIKYFGTGTQKAEEELGNIPDLKVLRMDQDSTRQKFAHEEILHKFKTEDYQALVGTQMVAKGHDIPKVTLVGVLSADSSLNLPDFRAAERTFNLLTQAAGRAGRGSKPGQVYFQTYDGNSPAVQLAAAQNYEAFAKGELKNRREYFYPPFCQMLKITILDQSEDNALNLANRIKAFLIPQVQPGKLELLGPFPALVYRVRDYYRINLLIKAVNMTALKKQLMNSEFSAIKNIYFDVDPLNVI